MPLAREIDLDALCFESPCDALHVLGSFWPYSTGSHESRMVKAFKESHPIGEYQPHISELCEFYAANVLQAVCSEKIDWVTRVLNSSECELDLTRPQSLLVDSIAKQSNARAITHVFFKSSSRSPCAPSAIFQARKPSARGRNTSRRICSQGRWTLAGPCC